ncbi:MAG: tRNA1(Val) (adenine(37)-N6)-methyltransferase [Deltaproteobacteria bacterium]|nr:tRNA1(Val) (adenine(37)-N6)-methyltransferase [Deltaproteobacteria bacterium]
MSLYTTDTFFNGQVSVKQSRHGYRFSIDAVLLARLAAVHPGERVVDLGAGCGIVSLLLAYRYPDIRLYGIELQQELAIAAKDNVTENHMQDRIVILQGDMKTVTAGSVGGPVDLVVSNPPYRKSGSGRINPDSQKALARHEIHVTIEGVARTARRLLKTAGRFVVVYPAERLADILTRMRGAGIEPKWLCMIHSGRKTPAKLMVIEGVKGGRPGMKIAPPLVIYREDGTYTPAVEKMFGT